MQSALAERLRNFLYLRAIFARIGYKDVVMGHLFPPELNRSLLAALWVKGYQKGRATTMVVRLGRKKPPHRP